MCKKQMGPRCSAAAKQSRQIVSKRLEKKQDEVNAYELKISDSLEKREEEWNGRDLIQLAKHERLHEELSRIRSDYKEAQINFYATPAGDKELEDRIAAARAGGDEFVEKQLLTLQNEAAELHSWQLSQLRDYKKLEEEGTPEEVLAAVENDLAKVDQEQAQAQEQIDGLVEQIKTEVPEVDEDKLYDFVNNKINDNQVIDSKDVENLIKDEHKLPAEETPEEVATLSAEELEERRRARRKQIRQLTLLASLAVGIIAASYIMQKATGKRSQILGYAKGFVTRNVMASGKKYLTKQTEVLGLPAMSGKKKKKKNSNPEKSTAPAPNQEQQENQEVFDVVRDEKIINQNRKVDEAKERAEEKTSERSQDNKSAESDEDYNWHEQEEPSFI